MLNFAEQGGNQSKSKLRCGTTVSIRVEGLNNFSENKGTCKARYIQQRGIRKMAPIKLIDFLEQVKNEFQLFLVLNVGALELVGERYM